MGLGITLIWTGSTKTASGQVLTSILHRYDYLLKNALLFGELDRLILQIFLAGDKEWEQYSLQVLTV